MAKTDLVLSAIRSVGASFPVASSVVNAWNEHAGRLQEEKCKTLIRDLSERVQALENRICRTEAECAKVFELALNYALRDPNVEKMPAYAGIVVSFCEGTADEDAAMNLIYEIESLLPFDIDSLAHIYPQKRIDSAFRFDERSSQQDVSKCQASVKKLEAKGLVGIGGESATTFPRLYEHGSEWPFTFYQQYYKVLPPGRLLLRITGRVT